jgi:hypothetical protein
MTIRASPTHMTGRTGGSLHPQDYSHVKEKSSSTAQFPSFVLYICFIGYHKGLDGKFGSGRDLRSVPVSMRAGQPLSKHNVSEFLRQAANQLGTGRKIANLTRERVAALCGLFGSRLGGHILSSSSRF